MVVFEIRVHDPLPPLPRDVLPAGKVAYLDIETTGLWARYHQVTVVGIVTATRGGRKLEQFFVEEPDDEGEVVEEVAERLAELAGVVVYNGVCFDLPFLRRRAGLYGVRFPWLEAWDLIRPARQLKKQGRVANCRLQTLLRRFRIARTDETTGADAVEAYEDWLSTGDTAARDLLLDHNAEDVLLLPELGARLSSPRGRAPGRAAG